MGFLFHVLLAFAVVSAGAAGLRTSAPSPVGLALLFLVPHLAGLALRRLLVAGRFRPAALVDRALRHAAPALFAAAELGCGWTLSVERWTGLALGVDGWPGPGLLVALVPYVVLELLAIDAHARATDARSDEIARSRRFHVRMLLAALVPFLAYVGVSMLIDVDERLRVRVEEVGLWGALFTLVLLGVLVLFLPRLLRSAWDTAPLERGYVRDLLEGVAQSARFRCRELLVWRTENQMANAAIVGFTPGSRVVLFSDALLAQLRPRELAAVFAHEIGHATRRHALVFAAFAGLFFLGADLVVDGFGIEGQVPIAAVYAVAIGLWYPSFGYLSRRFELEADLESRDALGDGEPLIAALAEVTGAHAHRRSSWRHFSTAQRVAFLRRVADDPAVSARLRRRLAWIARAGIASFVVVAALEVVLLARDLGRDTAVALLRLGEYERADERLASLDAPDPRALELAAQGRAVPRGDRTPAGLEEAARAALAAGRPGDARDLAELASLRGAAGLGPVLEALDRVAGGRSASAEARDLPAEWREPWRAAFGPAPGPDEDG